MSDIHIVKLCVGTDSVEDLLLWEQRQGEVAYIHTRNMPARHAELLSGGSLYWVIKGIILCRRRIVSFDAMGDKTNPVCRIGLSTAHIATHAQPRRPFQGWRYLMAADAPGDLADGDEALPPELARALKEAGVW